MRAAVMEARAGPAERTPQAAALLAACVFMRASFHRPVDDSGARVAG
jgi:hypothetical protein